MGKLESDCACLGKSPGSENIREDFTFQADPWHRHSLKQYKSKTKNPANPGEEESDIHSFQIVGCKSIIPDKIDFKSKEVTRKKEELYTLIKVQYNKRHNNYKHLCIK